MKASEIKQNDFNIDNVDNRVMQQAIQEPQFDCKLVCSNGLLCQQSFSTSRQLVMHQRHASKHQGQLVHLNAFVPTNQCPWCETILSSQVAAYQHVKNAFKLGRCKPELSFLPNVLKQIDFIFVLYVSTRRSNISVICHCFTSTSINTFMHHMWRK